MNTRYKILAILRNTTTFVLTILFTTLAALGLQAQQITKAEKIGFNGQEVWAVAANVQGDNGEALPYMKDYLDDEFDAEFEASTFFPKTETYFAKDVEMENLIPGSVDMFLKREDNIKDDRYYLVLELEDGMFLNPKSHPILFTNAREMMTKMVRSYLKEELEEEIDALDDEADVLSKQIRKNDRKLRKNDRKITDNKEEIEELTQENESMKAETKSMREANEYNRDELWKVKAKLEEKESTLKLLEQ